MQRMERKAYGRHRQQNDLFQAQCKFEDESLAEGVREMVTFARLPYGPKKTGNISRIYRGFIEKFSLFWDRGEAIVLQQYEILYIIYIYVCISYISSI